MSKTLQPHLGQVVTGGAILPLDDAVIEQLGERNIGQADVPRRLCGARAAFGVDFGHLTKPLRKSANLLPCHVRAKPVRYNGLEEPKAYCRPSLSSRCHGTVPPLPIML